MGSGRRVFEIEGLKRRNDLGGNGNWRVEGGDQGAVMGVGF